MELKFGVLRCLKTTQIMMDYLVEIASEFWGIFREMSPYLLFGFFFAGVLSVFLSAQFIERHLGGQGFAPVVKASLFGVPLPLCSCSVIPVATSLRRHGSSKAATTSFLLSTPQTGVDSILVTFSLLGPVFAVFRTLAAFITGIVGGGVINLFSKDKADDSQQEEVCGCGSCETGDNRSGIVRAFRHGFVTLPRDIGKSLLVGLLIAGAIGVFVPEKFFSDYIGTGFGSMLVMLVMGIPLYVCATASVPIAVAMIMKGVTPGAALVFLMTGPATNAATLGAIWHILGRRETFIYLAVVAVSALTCGILMDLFFNIASTSIQDMHGFMIPVWAQNISAVALLAIILTATFGKRHV